MASLARLSLTDFRSYASALIEPGPGFVLLSGDNGAGKTNLLEAVSLLTPGRGLRGAALGEMARKDGAGGFAVASALSPLPPAGGAGGGPVPTTQADGHALPPTPSRPREGRLPS